MKKILFGLFVIFLIIGCTQQSQVANPAAVYCRDQGYTYEIRTGPEGGQKGFCVFDDGSECPGWEYFNETCTVDTASNCKDLCGDGECQEVVCQAIGCPCPETPESCPSDCQ